MKSRRPPLYRKVSERSSSRSSTRRTSRPRFRKASSRRPLGNGPVAEVEGVLEDLRIRPEGDGRAGPASPPAPMHLRIHRFAPLEGLRPAVAFPRHLRLQTAGQRVHHRHPHPMQPSRYGIGPLLELAPGVKGGQDGGQGRLARAGVLRHGDAPPVVLDPAASVGQEGHNDAAGEPRHRLVHRVVHHLPDQMVETPRAGRSDVHAGPPAHGLQTRQDLDVLGVVTRCLLGGHPDSSQLAAAPIGLTAGADQADIGLFRSLTPPPPPEGAPW